ncbi:unnamed protein product [Rhizophagus irregularis]|nr:unnamed protein product [Rhizophagus irregularis]
MFWRPSSLNFLLKINNIGVLHTLKANPSHGYEHYILQGLLQELSTSVRGETIKNNEVAEDNLKASIPKTLACLFQKACRAEICATKAIQKEILCWYYYVKMYKEKVEEIKNAQRGVSDQSARNQVYDNIMEHLSDRFTKDTLCKKNPKSCEDF